MNLEELKLSQHREIYKSTTRGAFNKAPYLFPKGKHVIYLDFNVPYEKIKASLFKEGEFEFVKQVITEYFDDNDKLKTKIVPESFTKENYITNSVKVGKNNVKITKILSQALQFYKKSDYADTEDIEAAIESYSKFIAAIKTQTTRKYKIAISRHPAHIGAMSTDRRWTSCMNLEGGENRHFVFKEINISLIAYLIQPNDLEIKNPIGRIVLKPFQNTENKRDVVYCGDSFYGDMDGESYVAKKMLQIVDDYVYKAYKESRVKPFAIKRMEVPFDDESGHDEVYLDALQNNILLVDEETLIKQIREGDPSINKKVLTQIMEDIPDQRKKFRIFGEFYKSKKFNDLAKNHFNLKPIYITSIEGLKEFSKIGIKERVDQIVLEQISNIESAYSLPKVRKLTLNILNNVRLGKVNAERLEIEQSSNVYYESSNELKNVTIGYSCENINDLREEGTKDVILMGRLPKKNSGNITQKYTAIKSVLGIYEIKPSDVEEGTIVNINNINAWELYNLYGKIKSKEKFFEFVKKSKINRLKLDHVGDKEFTESLMKSIEGKTFTSLVVTTEFGLNINNVKSGKFSIVEGEEGEDGEKKYVLNNCKFNEVHIDYEERDIYFEANNCSFTEIYADTNFCVVNMKNSSTRIFGGLLKADERNNIKASNTINIEISDGQDFLVNSLEADKISFDISGKVKKAIINNIKCNVLDFGTDYGLVNNLIDLTDNINDVINAKDKEEKAEEMETLKDMAGNFQTAPGIKINNGSVGIIKRPTDGIMLFNVGDTKINRVIKEVHQSKGGEKTLKRIFKSLFPINKESNFSLKDVKVGSYVIDDYFKKVFLNSIGSKINIMNEELNMLSALRRNIRDAKRQLDEKVTVMNDYQKMQKAKKIASQDDTGVSREYLKKAQNQNMADKSEDDAEKKYTDAIARKLQQEPNAEKRQEIIKSANTVLGTEKEPDADPNTNNKAKKMPEQPMGMKNDKKKKKGKKKMKEDLLASYRTAGYEAEARLKFASKLLENDEEEQNPTNNEIVNKHLRDQEEKEKNPNEYEKRARMRDDDVVSNIDRAENGLEKFAKYLEKMRKVVRDIKTSYLQKEYAKAYAYMPQDNNVMNGPSRNNMTNR